MSAEVEKALKRARNALWALNDALVDNNVEPSPEFSESCGGALATIEQAIREWGQG